MVIKLYVKNRMYAVYMPKMIRPNFDITFSMMSTRNTNNTVFYYEFMSEDKQIHFMDSFIIMQGESLNFVVGSVSYFPLFLVQS